MVPPSVDITCSPSAGNPFIWNENGADADFRIESDTLTHHYFSDASVDRHGFNSSAPGDYMTIVQPVRTSGTERAFSLTSGAHTTLMASTEVTGAYFDFTATKQWATGAITTQRDFYILNATYAFVGASTITDAYTFFVRRDPAAGANATITRAWCAGFGSGAVEMQGSLIIGTSLTAPSKTLDVRGAARIDLPLNALGGGAGATLGTIGGTGPTVAGQNTWAQINISGTTYWLPVWV